MSGSKQVIYEDNHLLVVHKMAGQLSQGDITKDPDVATLFMPYIKKKYNKPGNVFLQPVHRLDRPVSGCMILARTSKASSRLTQAFRDGQVTKHYLAISDKRADQEFGTLENRLIKDGTVNRVKVARTRDKKGKEAILKYELISSLDGIHMYHIKPITGRSHQIRVQMSHIGVPLLGDLKYGGSKTETEQAIALHCFAMTFMHPTLKKSITVKTYPSYPDYWKLFRDAMRSVDLK
ncbi:MAG: 23S rRNA pseudouridine1911/1915/1917 synthase [Saprospiraceae bacterium]|jgi:23S rRNA pseudouridine1911/1915/1917 synthase